MTYNKSDTTGNDLLNVIKHTQPTYKPLPGYEGCPNGGYDAGVDLNEVYPNLFIGDGCTAKNKMYLKRIGISHVLNAAEGYGFGMVDTSAAFYKDTHIKYLGLKLMDHPTANISEYFKEASEFIELGLKWGGKVYVHCLVGMSRSSTCVIAFLMLKRDMSASDAIRKVRNNRRVAPNMGFLNQLADLDNQLRRDKERKKESRMFFPFR